MSRTWFINLAGRWRHPAVAALIGTLTLATSGCDRGDANGQQVQHPPPSVTVASAVSDDVPIYLDEIGKIQSIQTVAVMPQVGGIIVAAPVEEGSPVKKGDLLFQIDKRPYEARLRAAEASLAQAKAAQRFAEVEFRRIQQLAKTDVASQLEFDQKQSDLEVAEAKIAAAEADIQSARLNLEYTTITSPIDGRAGARLVDVGNVVQESGQVLVRIQQIDPIYAQFTITENDLGTVRKFMVSSGLDLRENPERGMKVFVEVPADARQITEALGALPIGGPATRAASTAPSAAAIGPREGTLTFLDSNVQGATGTVMLRAVVPNEDHYFWPGQFVKVRLVLAHKKDAVLVPLAAIQLGTQGAYVFVVERDGEHTVANIRPVVQGQRYGELVAIDRGLKTGENVIIAGQMMVQPGGPVTVAAAPGGGSPAPSVEQPVALAR